jgi:hypothetical protein
MLALKSIRPRRSSIRFSRGLFAISCRPTTRRCGSNRWEWRRKCRCGHARGATSDSMRTRTLRYQQIIEPLELYSSSRETQILLVQIVWWWRVLHMLQQVPKMFCGMLHQHTPALIISLFLLLRLWNAHLAEWKRNHRVDPCFEYLQNDTCRLTSQPELLLTILKPLKAGRRVMFIIIFIIHRINISKSWNFKKQNDSWMATNETPMIC